MIWMYCRMELKEWLNQLNIIMLLNNKLLQTQEHMSKEPLINKTTKHPPKWLEEVINTIHLMEIITMKVNQLKELLEQ